MVCICFALPLVVATLELFYANFVCLAPVYRASIYAIDLSFSRALVFQSSAVESRGTRNDVSRKVKRYNKHDQFQQYNYINSYFRLIMNPAK